MATVKKYFYLAKGENDDHPWMFYGEEPPRITDDGFSTSVDTKCVLISSFIDNPIAYSIKDNEIVKLYIRKETKKNK